MFRPVQRWKLHRQRTRRIKELNTAVMAEYAKTHDPDPMVDADILFQVTREDQYELDRLLQAPFLNKARNWGLDIPEEYWEIDPVERQATLTEKGKNWIKREVGKRRREWAKDWVAIILPLLSAVIAILGLVVALVKRRG